MEHNGMAETPKKRSVKKRAGVALIWFFVAMVALTYISRAVSESLKARVRTGYPGASTLDESVEGTGAWAAGEAQLYTTYYTRRITQVYVRPGQTVTLGDPLFAYDVSTIKGGKEVSDKRLQAAQEALKKAEATVEDAEDPLYVESVAASARQALAYAEFTYAQTYALQNGGVVRATFAGTLVKCDLTPGKASAAGSTGFEIAPDGVKFTLTVTAKEAERISLEDAVTLYDDGKEEKGTLSVAEIHAPDAEDRVQVICAGDGGRERLTGARQDWKIKKQSGKYNLCVPLSALRQSGPAQYYVLVLSEKETILGTELTVRAEAVKLLNRDSQRAAVEGSVSERDRLVTESSKELKDGDYVALREA